MSLKASLPGYRDPIVGQGGLASRPVYTFFQAIATTVDSLSGQIGNVTTSPSNSPISDSANVTGAYSVYAQGTLKTGIVKVLLLGDVQTPGNTQYYGSDATGERGWFAVSDAFAASGNVTISTAADGVSSFDLSDTGITAGTYGSATKAVAVTYDAKGRASGIAEKDIRILSDTAPSSPTSGLRWIDTTMGTEYVWYVDGDSSQWVEFGPNAVSVADGPAVQTIQAGSGVAVDNTDPFNPVISASLSGGVLQYVEVVTANKPTTTSTGIPLDNTIPQNTEGDELVDFRISITPISATSRLVVSINLSWLATSTSGAGVRLAAFRDSGANAVFATSMAVQGNSPARLEFSVPSSATTTTSFKFRWAVSSGTAYLHATSGTAAAFGGVLTSSVTIREVIV